MKSEKTNVISKALTYNEIDSIYPCKTHYIAYVSLQNIVTGKPHNYISVSTKTGEKNKYGGDIYADEKIFYTEVKPNKYKLTQEDPRIIKKA
jgi:hypothetical protein